MQCLVYCCNELRTPTRIEMGLWLIKQYQGITVLQEKANSHGMYELVFAIRELL